MKQSETETRNLGIRVPTVRGDRSRGASGLTRATGATVVLVHHAGKDTSKGARGWSGLRAAADAELEVVRSPEGRLLRVTKQKEGSMNPSSKVAREGVRVNELGRRIGESHPRAVLTDAQVEQLLEQRVAGASLAALARRWGISKSGVKGLVDGSRRGQVGPTVSRAPSQRERVRAWVSLTLAERAQLRRLGGSKFVRRALEAIR